MFTFFKAICLIWKNRGLLAKLLELLPPALNAAGEGMKLAGQGAVTAGNFVKGGGGVPVNARQVLTNAATAINTGKQRVDDTANFLESTGTEIGKIKVPSVAFTTTSIPLGLGTIEVVTGITITEVSLFGLVRDALKDSAGKLRNVSTQLQTAGNSFSGASDAMNDAGENLKTLGNFLVSSGQALKEAAA